MTNHMAKPPYIFFFGDSVYTELSKTIHWTIHLVNADVEHTWDMEHTLEEE